MKSGTLFPSSSTINIENIGLYFAKYHRDNLRLSIDATHLLKNQIKNKIIELDDKQFEEYMKGRDVDIKRKLKNAVGLLTYQKFYSDEVLEKALVDSMEVVNYYNEHIDEFNEQKLNEVFSRISGQLRNTKIDRIRKDIYEQLRNKYEVVVNESAFEKLLEEAK